MSETPKTPFIFFGNPQVAARTLERLLDEGYVPSLVVTAPDRPSGRGLALTPTPVRVLAQDHELPVITPERLDEAALDAIAAAQAPYAIVVAYGKILPENLITSFPQGVLNVHYSLLPKYRGASPVEAALLKGDTVTGVTIQKMVYALDAGDIVAVAETPIHPEETAITLRTRLIELGAELLVRALPHYLSGATKPTPQDHTQASHCGKIQKNERELTLSGDHVQNWRRYRALAEGPGTHFYAMRGGKRLRVKIVTASFVNNVFTPLRIIPEGKQEQDFAVFLQSGAVPL